MRSMTKTQWREGYRNLRTLIANPSLRSCGQFVRVYIGKSGGEFNQVTIYNANTNRLIATYGKDWVRYQHNSVYAPVICQLLEHIATPSRLVKQQRRVDYETWFNAVYTSYNTITANVNFDPSMVDPSMMPPSYVAQLERVPANISSQINQQGYALKVGKKLKERNEAQSSDPRDNSRRAHNHASK